MRQLVRILVRIAIIAMAVALFAGLITIYARTMRPPGNQGRAQGDPRDHRDKRSRGDFGERGGRGDPRRRPDTPQLSAFPEIFKEGGLFALLTLAGRKVLRLRL